MNKFVKMLFIFFILVAGYFLVAAKTAKNDSHTLAPIKEKTVVKTLTFTPTPTIEKIGSDITIYAAGEQALDVYPIMVLVIKGEVVKTFQDVEGNPGKREFQTFDYSSRTKVVPDDVQVQFVNDYYDPDAGQDRNLYVDKIVIDGKPYESEAETVWSTGSTSPGERCTEGAKKTEELDCNGYFQYFQTK